MLKGEAEQPTYTGHKPLPGGKGVVAVADHAILGRKCIQKTFEIVGREDAVAFNEPRLIDDLDHPHITPIQEAQFAPHSGGRKVTMVMRVYEGGSVRAAQTLANHSFGVGDALAITRQMAEALGYLHTVKGYVHRDVKPGNILLDADRATAYLSDFGSAATLAGGASVNAVRMTPVYQPPEAGATGQVGPAADIYGLGMALYEMLNGAIAWEALEPATIDRRINKGLRALPDRVFGANAFAPHVPTVVVRLVRTMIDPKPDRRPSANELARTIRSLQILGWTRTEGTGLTGTWNAWWPPRRRRDQQTQIRITSVELKGGANSGKLRIAARYQRDATANLRRVGPDDATIGSHDHDALCAFFKTVDTEVARRWPA